jgi:hypothetical protein
MGAKMDFIQHTEDWGPELDGFPFIGKGSGVVAC